jgi:hypothetical protein
MSDALPNPTLLPLAAEMSPEERERYERDCLAELEGRMARSRGNPHRPQEVQQIRLVGSFPETAIQIVWRDTRDGDTRERAYNLWKNPVAGDDANLFEYRTARLMGREVPQQVAMLVDTWVLES